ncbi:MAG: type II toxin-antitoxin system VapC family toxin [Crocinitomicaceae bacterium]|nr:type II toxin-antitoxin system VapC family toxin [Crocinitomicaceae bacterium]MBK8926727.1 type II toxin-antitoxin system VapC family toxin [Crocinitomicaceae bacterium]
MNFVFDTNVILYYLTKNALAEKLDLQINPFKSTNLAIISIVTEAELMSLAYQRNWGESNIGKLEKLLEQFLKIPIQSNDLIKAYADIDCFSQKKSKTHTYQADFSPKNMGKNDIWIAATATVTNSTLITNDNDFDHLRGIFSKVISLNKDLK